MTTPDNNALLQLQVDCGIPHPPTPLTYELRLAVSGEGPRAYDWSDKPHRLLYDACREIERNAGQVAALAAERDAAVAACKTLAVNELAAEVQVVQLQRKLDAAIAELANLQEKIDELRENEIWRKIHND